MTQGDRLVVLGHLFKRLGVHIGIFHLCCTIEVLGEIASLAKIDGLLRLAASNDQGDTDDGRQRRKVASIHGLLIQQTSLASNPRQESDEVHALERQSPLNNPPCNGSISAFLAVSEPSLGIVIDAPSYRLCIIGRIQLSASGAFEWRKISCLRTTWSMFR